MTNKKKEICLLLWWQLNLQYSITFPPRRNYKIDNYVWLMYTWNMYNLLYQEKYQKYFLHDINLCKLFYYNNTSPEIIFQVTLVLITFS